MSRNADRIKRVKQSLRLAENSRAAARASVIRAETVFAQEEAKVHRYLRELVELGMSDEEIIDLSRVP